MKKIANIFIGTIIIYVLSIGLTYAEDWNQTVFTEGEFNITNGSTFFVAVGERIDVDTWTGTYSNLFRATGVTFEIIGTNVNWTSSLDSWTGNGTGSTATGNLNGIINITTAVPSIVGIAGITITLTNPLNATITSSTEASFNTTFVQQNINATNNTFIIYHYLCSKSITTFRNASSS